MRSTILNRTTNGIVATATRMQRPVQSQTNVVSQHRRTMAGGPISAKYKVTKNKFVEEWNGKREITEKLWECDSKMAANLFLYVVALPYGAYVLTRSEFQSKGDRRYKDCF